MITPIVITYISVSVFVTLFAIGRRISFAGAFVTSLLMSPVVGLIAIFKSEKNIKIKYYTTRYVCPQCNIEYTQEKENCDFCKEMGNEVKLQPNRVLIHE
ncbi:MAG: hypothetical protein GXO88_02905 [Chlorobi bacterium]|nr:hypothetical protein [Chlorobiota bacterium]